MTSEADQEGLSTHPFPDAPPGFVIRGVLWLRRALLRVADRLVPPDVVLFEHATGLAGTMLIGAAARLRLADLIGDGARTSASLAALTGTDSDALHRTMRALATKGIFDLLPDGRFRNNRLSEPLKSGKPWRTRAWVQYFASRSNVAAWADFDQTLISGDSAFARVYGQSIWTYFDAHPEERAQFAEAMMGLTIRDAPMIARRYPFGEVHRLCDVGGGCGTLLSELLIRHRHLTGVLYDNPGVLKSAASLFAGRGVADRVTLIPGSFFETVPSGCDGYLLKHVLHDWDDPTCVRILQVCRRAMTGTSRLLLVETVTERHAATGMGPLSDVQMMVACDKGRERSEAELTRLLMAAGFRLAQVYRAPTFSILDSRPEPDYGASGGDAATFH